jgi:hypothetical protein
MSGNANGEEEPKRPLSTRLVSFLNSGLILIFTIFAIGFKID